MDVQSGVEAHCHHVFCVKRNGKRRSTFYNEGLPVGRHECDFRFRHCYALEHTVTILAVGPVFPVLAVRSGGFPQLRPGGAIVRGNVPVTVLYLQLRRDTVLPFSSVRAHSLDLLAVGVQQPFTIYSPVPDAVGVLLHANHRRMAVGSVFSVFPVGAVLAVFAVFAIGPVLTMINGDRITFGKSEGIAHGLAALDDRRH